MPPYREPLLTRTKIVATVGPACRSPDVLREMVLAGVDVFRLNFAHGTHEEKAAIVAAVRGIAAELGQPVGVLGDLSGPKIRLGELPPDGLTVQADRRYTFVRAANRRSETDLTTSYDGLIDDLREGDRLLLADGSVALRVSEKHADRVVCEVEQPGRLLSRQGVNLPGSRLRIASLTEKDLVDLRWALEQGLDFVGLSFVRCAADIRHLREQINTGTPAHRPFIVAKIEKPEAVDDLDNILHETDMVMVARGDLGVEVDIVRVPVLQKQIIAACNHHCVPVITATQMLESMQQSELPTRAEATDVANAVLDGTDAVMLSGETAVGRHPVRVVTTMSRIAREAEPLLVSRKDLPLGRSTRSAATDLTLAVTLGAIHAAEQLQAGLLVLLTRSGVTAAAVSELRSRVPILALTDDPRTAARLTLTWGVHALVTDRCARPPQEVIDFVRTWGLAHRLLSSGSRFVIVGTTDWSRPGKDVMLVSTVP
jgi:pyruvate kinase